MGSKINKLDNNMSLKQTWTEAQQNIFNFIEMGTGNGIIDAVAGAGKTTTLMGCVSHIPNMEDVLYCAFNTSIRKELQKKFHADNIDVRVCTIHSLGFQMLRTTQNYKLDDSKYKNIVKDTAFFETLSYEIDAILEIHSCPTIANLRQLEERKDSLDWNEKNTLNEGKQYVNKIIQRLLDINQKYRCILEQNDIKHFDLMVQHFGIFTPWEVQCSNYAKELEYYFQAHTKILNEGKSIAISHGIIDYTDQIYLPFAFNLTAKKKYGFVFVDECQDLSKAQLYVVKQYLREDGRLLAVGDPYQAIYGFAGADCESFDRIKSTFNCTELKLADCFRCPQSVIQLAQSIRPDIKGFKQSIGIVSRLKLRDIITNVNEGDLIICRRREPLMTLALQLVAKDFKVKIHPDELQEFIGNYKRNFTIQELQRALDVETLDTFFENIRQRNIKRIHKENQNVDSIIRNVLIKEEVVALENTLDFLKHKFFDWHLNTLESILARLKHTLSYTGDEAIKVYSIHRAKGLENDRVFILEYNKLPYKRELEWEQIQERNLHYVAVTRAKETLYLCEDIVVDDIDDIETAGSEPAETNVVQSESVVYAPIQSFIKIRPIQSFTKIPTKFYSLDEQEDTPYTGLNNSSYQKAKYWSIVDNLQDTEFEIKEIVCKQYLDVYYIDTPDGVEGYNGYYNINGQYKFQPIGSNTNAEQVLHYLNNESNYRIKFEYQPQDYGFEAVHETAQTICQELGICITNIYFENYTLVYCFKTPLSYAYIKLSYNGKKIITTLMPFSSIGDSDEYLNSIIDALKHLWYNA